MHRRDLLFMGASVPLRGRAAAPAPRIRRVEVVRYQGPKSAAEHLEIEAAGGIVGVFGPLGWSLPAQLAAAMPVIREHLRERDASDRRIEFESLWRALYPGRSLDAYARGVDPLTGAKVWGTTRGGRHTPTGLKIMALSAVDNALWDLRGKLLGRPVHRLIGRASRPRLEVYSRVGEGKDLAQARRQARERFDRGQKHQKWYFVYGPKDGPQGLRANLELVRVVREELGSEAVLMFDNHSMRFEIGPEWVVELAKRMLPYRPFWLEEPTAPEDLEGYARIKGETGITLAGGEHHFTRWQIQPLLERGCLDWVQSDPDWCGGISEWLRIAALAGRSRGVRVVPHCDNFMTNVQCVASQPVALCPLVEYNDGQTESKMSFRTRILRPVNEVIDTPPEVGLGPDLDRARITRAAT